jgi:hypothetical protein
LTLGIAPKRAKPRWLTALTVVTVVSLLSAGIALAGPVGVAGGFEDDDANLVDNATTGIDWNTFQDVSWLPANSATPTRQADKIASGFKFKGIEDWQSTTSDSGFAGGTKQDDNCATVITAKAPNKDDLKRIYLASTVAANGHTYLNLGWVRIPQNTTSPSAHIGFEFNQGSTPCAGNSGLVNRTAGDLLIVYDFEGGGTPVLTLRRWVASGACEVSSDSAPCWGVATNLTAGGDAEGAVNTGSTVLDQLAPPALGSSTSVDATLGLSEFGEAGVDLTDAGVFTPGTCQTFGTAFGVSRSSGSSGTAQMKDLAGPAPFRLSNCGTVTIIKQTNPRGLNQNFSFTSTLSGGQLTCSQPSPETATSFTLNDTGNAGKTLGSTTAANNSAGNTQTCTNVPIGSYTVTEGANPTGFEFESLTCTATGSATAVQHAAGSKQADIAINSGDDTATCVYVNRPQQGAIKISKTDGKTGNALNGATFSITKGGTAITGSPFTITTGGSICVDNLGFGDYVVTETAAPAGYSIDDTTGHTVTVDNNAKCSDATFVGETISFSDTPLSDIQVRFRDGGSGVTSATISCDNSTGDTSTTGTTGWDSTTTITGIEAPVTVTCTIVIDP